MANGGPKQPLEDKLFEFLYKHPKAAETVTGISKGIGTLAESPIFSHIPLMPVGLLMKGLDKLLDKAAYKIGSQEIGAVREKVDFSSQEGRKWMSGLGITGDPYTGMWSTDSQYLPPLVSELGASELRKKTQISPNLLKIFIGMEKNTLEPSKVAPTSWTKPTPDQGWYSGKAFSQFKPRPIQEYAHFKDLQTYLDLPHTAKTISGMKKLVDAVESGTYDPDKHAVTGPTKQGGSGLSRMIFDFDTEIDVANFTQSLGYDEEKKQYYFSITDVWDFEKETYAKEYGGGSPKKETMAKVQAGLMQSRGKSVGVYDRYYLPKGFVEDWVKGPQKPKEKNVVDKVVDFFKDEEYTLPDEEQ
mgnify:CR=1 FL=1